MDKQTEQRQKKKKNKRIIIHTADIHAIFVRRITYWK